MWVRKQKWFFWQTSYIVSENNQTSLTSLTHANNVPNSRFEIAYFKSYISLRKLGCICMTNKVLCSKYGTWPKACFQYWNFRQNHWFFLGWKHVNFFFKSWVRDVLGNVPNSQNTHFLLKLLLGHYLARLINILNKEQVETLLLLFETLSKANK